MEEVKQKNILESYPILPLRNTILFPNQIIPIYIGRKQSLNLINDIHDLEKKYIVVVAQKDGAIENPKDDDIYTKIREISRRLIIKIEPWSDFQTYRSYFTSKLKFLRRHPSFKNLKSFDTWVSKPFATMCESFLFSTISVPQKIDAVCS